MSVDYYVELDKLGNPHHTDEFTTRYHSLIANGNKKAADELRGKWSKYSGKVTLAEPDSRLWQMIAKPSMELTLLPLSSWFIQFTFTLAKPYLSKDDNPFYIIDNPIIRDKVFGLPMVRSTSWKGNLYSALWQTGHDKEDDEQMQRLFGETRGEEGGQAGRLYFYPTFFTQTGLEIINPHDRKRRVGKNPILFECVPDGARGTFSLLYVPFDLIGQDEAEIRRQAAKD
ncbi:MAG: RAMP superfamily CRISPR-associated protein, partial [Anaerolineales bacterium]